MKRILTATDPKTGKVFTRKTARTYTHVVLVEGEGSTGPIGWCGRYDLAVKLALGELARLHQSQGAEVRIVPVDGEVQP